ncbi:FRG domain-containing protein [Pontibacter locisalis]|uniref:FRG domain-containing protein n=1 Tax=Pontibacter locisalis TaxID=1719035 RepID=A0ABW5IHT7_9BACT
MRSITPELTEELHNQIPDVKKIKSSTPVNVDTFRELVEHIAKLSYVNKDHMLFFRGQANDYVNKAGNSTFYPSIYRGDYVSHKELINRFDILEGASRQLVKLFEEQRIDGYKDLKRRKYIQWSILQHYEVCATPLLDFTHSLRVACSFATNDNVADHAYIFVFGLPYITNRISINSEHDLVNVRLLSICPPRALRPHFQEGYLVGTDDVTTGYETKTELDFHNRLIIKFKIPNTTSFWGTGFSNIPKESLYPDNDIIQDLCSQIKDLADKELKSGELGDFLKAWSQLEDYINNIALNFSKRYLPLRESIKILEVNYVIPSDLFREIDNIRKFRNILVHTPIKVKNNDIVKHLNQVNDLLNFLRNK